MIYKDKFWYLLIYLPKNGTEQVVHWMLLDSCKTWSLLYKWVKNLWMIFSSISYRINNISELVKEINMF